MLKIIGAVLIFAACTCFGFFKSFELKSRVVALKNILLGLENLKIAIGNSDMEIEQIFAECFFCCNGISYSGGMATVDCTDITYDDTVPLQKLFSEIGHGNRETERKRIDMCIEQTEKNIFSAENAYRDGARLRQSLGICIGFALGIMVI